MSYLMSTLADRAAPFLDGEIDTRFAFKVLQDDRLPLHDADLKLSVLTIDSVIETLLIGASGVV